MRDYSKFSKAIDASGLENALMEAWKRYEPGLTRRTQLTGGIGVCGSLTWAPTPMAMEVREIVRSYFTRALEIVAAQLETTQ